MNYEPDERMKHVDHMEEAIVDALGPTGALEAISKAMSYDDKRDLYEYILRAYEISMEEANHDEGV